MGRLGTSICVGIVTAVLLTAVRGSWRDSPYVVPVFGLVGFLFAYGISSWTSYSNLKRLEKTLAEYAWVRSIAAAVFLLCTLLWVGPLIQGAGFSGWLVALLAGLLIPLIVCTLATLQPIVMGFATASCITISTLVSSPLFRNNLFHANAWRKFLEDDIYVWLVIWLILFGQSLLVSVPLTIQRRRVASVGTS